MYLRARLGLGYLPQEPSIFRKMTAAQNILAVLETMNIRRRERFKRLEERFQKLPLPGTGSKLTTTGTLTNATSSPEPASDERIEGRELGGEAKFEAGLVGVG